MTDVADISIYTDAFIDELLNCEKKIIASPTPKNKSNGMHKETGMTLESTDGNYRFSVFVREHTQLMEIFSVGLVFIPDGSPSIILVRYNGDHGEHKNQLTGEVFTGCHKHRLSEKALQIGLKGENNAEKTNDYSTVKEAMRVFFAELKVINYTDYFPELLQTEMFN